VSRAHDRELGRDVAIKELISRGPGEARFVREALITARLEHPGIVPVHEAGRWPDGTPFYAMKLVSGRPLRELLAERRTVEERIGLLHHVIAVADAIAYAHGRNIIHRDLKPSNVIVGEFGETVVIDWGIAKDLSAPEDSGVGGEGGSPDQIAATRDLTATGSILGTPAYMAPEQERGEAVDQRADVFAIGAMLWELCVQRRTPPGKGQERRQLLRQAGIDRDLVAIIDKALDPDREQRYANAGALASDLKAFKAGARIAARRYTLPAVAAHWIRRHRTLALAVAAALVLAAGGAVVYVRNIAAERDRVEAALVRLEAANNDRILDHAALLLHTDPTAAVAALADYRGGDEVRRRRLYAEAEGRGVARAVIAPHNDTVWFAAGDSTGAIVSVGEDGRVQLTRSAAGKRGGSEGSTTLASDASTEVIVAYAPARQLLAYATAPTGIAVLDLTTRTLKRIPGVKPRRLRFSPDEARLAALDRHGEIDVWSIGSDAVSMYKAVHAGATQVQFATPSRLVVQDRAGLRAIALDAAGGAPDTASLPDLSSIDATADAVAAGTSDGRIAMLGPGFAVLSTTPVCHQRVRHARFIPHTDRLAFACQDKVAGVVRYDREHHELSLVDTFATRGVATVTPEATGKYVAVTDESNTAYVYDTATRILTHYDGSAGQPAYVAAPSPGFDHVLVGDVNGTVRVWDPPARAARVVLQAPSAIFGIGFTPDGKALFTGGADHLVRRIDSGGGAIAELRGHADLVLGVRIAPDGSSVASLSYDGSVVAWRASDGALLRRLTDHGSVVQDADYVEHGRRVASVGDDGRLLVWSPGGHDLAVVFQHPTPLTAVETLVQSDHLAIKDAAGSVWDVALDGGSRKVREADGTGVTTLRASPDGRYLATGTDAGVVTVYDTSDWRVITTVRAEGAIHQIQFDPRGRDLVIASEAGRAPTGHVQVVALGVPRRLRWRDIAVSARDIAYTSDGETLGFVCGDGGAWLYSIPDDTWAYTRDHDTDVLSGRFSPDGKLFATTDRRGVIVVRSVPATLAGARISSSGESP
ncbi:MAG TPA: WD40 repeat domain-containing serine/threonine protein kinase, partial [Kofleriaceae bacterium]|nr:WD40 repeat domain-containing serine/threonine protein kinase [Kofleriaceae bacterium]